MIHISLLLLMGNVSRNMFANPQTANAPTIPFTPLQVGGWQYQPNGEWQRSNWDGSGWVPVTGDYATGNDRSTLDGARTDSLTRTAAQQAEFERALNGTMPLLFPPGLPTNVDNQCNRDYTAARGWTLPRDPLVLDLDGDGIETVGINPLAPVLFDHDNDGVRTGTGWIKSDDGLLVLDRNGNGTIDGGAELFGDNTPGAAGALAANGFIALQGQDSNGDGQINSQDTSYTQLRVWRDLNQDGISQAGELQTLGQAGIASIGVAGTATNVNLGNGNTQIASGSFTRTNGTTGQSGTAELTGSFLLAGNDFYREFTNDPTPTAAAIALPQMRGSGWVHDLREATGAGSLLEQRLAAYAAAPTRAAQRALLEGLIEAWAKSTGQVQAVDGRYLGIWTLEVLPAGISVVKSRKCYRYSSFYRNISLRCRSNSNKSNCLNAISLGFT